MQLARRIANRIALEMDLQKLMRERTLELRDDPNYRLELVVQGFRDRPQEDIDDSAALERIVRSYNKAKTAQKDAPEAYQVSNEWLPIYNRNLGKVMKALSEGNLTELAGIYRNFFRDPCSAGLVGLSINMKKRYLNGEIKKRYQTLYLIDTLCRYRLWCSLTEQRYSVQSLASSSIGNPYGFELDGVFVSSGSEYLHYYSTKVSELVEHVEHPVVAELGGGYGGMAYYLVRDIPMVTYVDFDLPENLALTSYYLLRAFPTLDFVLYGEMELNNETLCNSRIVLMPNFEISKMPSNSADLVFNSYSLAEMSALAIEEYIKHMTRIGKKHFMHVNHTTNCLVGADKFGIERHGYEIVYRKPALWNRGRMLEVDEYEFLYSKA